MTPPTLLERLKQARIVQVLLVYLGASWVVLQFVDTLVGLLSMPAWVGPVAVVLMGVGLMVVLATAWVQSMPSTTAKEEAGELPTDWQVAPADVVASLMAGKLPHLTWGRAILGGVFALSLLFGFSGVYVLVTGKRAPGFGPQEAGADVAATGIAVVPFDVRGQNLDIWREGMVDLLSNNLDGVGGFRTIDPRTVMARWKESVGDATNPDLDAALRAAGATGARYAIIGSVVGIGDDVRLVTNVYDLDTREEVAQSQSEGTADEVLRLVDDLAVGTVRSLLQSTGREGAGDLTAETLTTESLDALREFLEGERHYRKGDFAEAVQSFERAVAADSSFAIGLVRLSEAYGWLESQGSERMLEYGERAAAHTEQLPPRYQFIMSAWTALNRGSADGLPVLRQAVQKYPDDPEAWFLLAETLIHVPAATYATLDEIERALDRAIALDPNFAPYWVHAADLAIFREDRAAAEAAVARYAELAGDERGVASHKIAIPLLLGDGAEVEAALQAARQANVHELDVLLGTYNGTTNRFDRLATVDEIFGDARGSNQTASIAWRLVSAGHLAEATEWAASANMSNGNLGIFFGHQYVLWEAEPQPELADRARPSLCDDPYNTTCHLWMAPLFAGTGRWDDLAASVRSVRAAARESAAEGDTALAATRDAYAEVMEAQGTWRRGDLDGARRVLEGHQDKTGFVRQMVEESLAEVNLAQGRWDRAIHHAQFRALGYERPWALYVQAKAYEGEGDTEKAREAWRNLVSITRDGDPDIPRVLEAREALARLGG